MRYFLLILAMTAYGILGYELGKSHGMEQGRSMALKTNPPSEEFEMACLGVWLGEQNRKYYEKENRSAR